MQGVYCKLVGHSLKEVLTAVAREAHIPYEAVPKVSVWEKMAVFQLCASVTGDICLGRPRSGLSASPTNGNYRLHHLHAPASLGVLKPAPRAQVCRKDVS